MKARGIISNLADIGIGNSMTCGGIWHNTASDISKLSTDYPARTTLNNQLNYFYGEEKHEKPT